MITPALLLSAYAQGIFPMARSREAQEVEWFSPEERGVIPLDAFHVPKSLVKFMKKNPFRLTRNQAFRDVITACAETRTGHEGTWINDEIIDAYYALHLLSHAQSIECWHGETLVGGLYGVSLGRAFFGESMFSRETNASKVALVHLVEWLKSENYALLDTQYVNEHLTQFGVKAIARKEYLEKLKNALLPC